jgi:hypothetical protein
MARRKLSPCEILERLQEIEGFSADGQSLDAALRVTGTLQAEYDQWRGEYAGLLRTLGPLASAPPKLAKRPRRVGAKPAK